jgi:hypothetical protein
MPAGTGTLAGGLPGCQALPGSCQGLPRCAAGPGG